MVGAYGVMGHSEIAPSWVLSLSFPSYHYFYHILDKEKYYILKYYNNVSTHLNII